MTGRRSAPRHAGRPPASPWKCERCHDQRWVCAAHDRRPFDSGNCCAADGMPCPKCNAGQFVTIAEAGVYHVTWPL